MSTIESEEASNDDTNIISELLNSAEAMQTSTVPIAKKMPLQDDKLLHIRKTDEISTFSNTIKQDVMISFQQKNGVMGGGIFNSQYSVMEDLNKMNIRSVHIPYILNGELYQIQTQDGENVTVKCCHCPPDRVYRGSVRSTGNFHMHIKRRHPDLLEKLHNMKVNALLERRDRLIRNRKITHRNNRNRSANSICNSNDMCSFKNNENPEMTTSTPDSPITLESTTESSLMHSHKLKIKTVFQRHQMQQKEAEEMRNWINTEFVVMPIVKLPANEESDQPINYSLKSHENNMIFSDSLNITQQQQNEVNSHMTTQTSFDCFTNTNNQPPNLPICNASVQKNINSENHTNNRNSPTTSNIISSYTSCHQYEVETGQPYNSFPLQHHNLSIIKPEELLLVGETDAIDLTMHTDSGIYSSSEDNDSESNNNESAANNIAVGMEKSNTPNVTVIDAEHSSDSGSKIDLNIVKWQDIFVQVQNSLRDIQREMNIRNQIESNRLFLDIAKFKFLNPGFQFNW